MNLASILDLLFPMSVFIYFGGAGWGGCSERSQVRCISLSLYICIYIYI